MKTLVTRTYDAAGRLVHETNNEEGTKFRNVRYNDHGHVIHDYTEVKDADNPSKVSVSEMFYDGDRAAGYDGVGNVLSYQMKQIQRGGGEESYYRYNDYSIRYRYFDTYKEAGTLAVEFSNGHSAYQGGDPMMQPGSTHFMYDAWGNEVLCLDVTRIPKDYTKNRISFYRHTADGKILTKHLVDGMDVNDTSDHKKLSDDYNYLFNTETIGSVTSKRGEGGAHEEFIYNFSPVVSGMETQLPATDARYITNEGDTLGNIARTLYGDSSLWYLIADANGLSSNKELRPGMSLKIPAATGQVGNSADVFKTYNPGEIIGDTHATQAVAPPTPPEQLSKCQQAVVLIVSIVVTYYTNSAGLGNMAGQMVTAMMMDSDYEYDLDQALKAEAIGRITQGITRGLGLNSGSSAGANAGGAGAQAGAANTGASVSSTGANIANTGATVSNATASASSALMNTATSFFSAVAQNVISQGVSMALGEQEEFSWGSVAAAGLMSTTPLDGLQADAKGGFSFAEIARETFKGVARGVIQQSVKVAIDGKGKIDMALIAADAFGNALGNSIAAQMENSRFDNEKATDDINDFLARKNQESINQFENQLNGDVPKSNPLDPRSHFTPTELARMKELGSTLTDENIAAEQKGLSGVSGRITISNNGKIASTGGINDHRYLTYLNKNGEEVRFRLDELLFSYIEGEKNSFGDGLPAFEKTAELLIQQGREYELSPVHQSLLLEDIGIHRDIIESSGAEQLSTAGRYVSFGQISKIAFEAGKKINKFLLKRNADNADHAQRAKRIINTQSLRRSLPNGKLETKENILELYKKYLSNNPGKLPTNIRAGGKRTEGDRRLLEHISTELEKNFQKLNPQDPRPDRFLDKQKFNVAFGDFKIDGDAGFVKAFSGTGEMKGFTEIPDSGRMLTTILDNGRSRALDTEVKIFLISTIPKPHYTVYYYSINY